MDALRQQYETQRKAYDVLAEQAIRAEDTTQLPKLREMNAGLAKTLNQMIEQLTFLKKNTPTLAKERDELMDRLRQIQKEYNELSANRDQLETLRRIRQQESSEGKRQLYLFLLFFLLVSLGIVVYLLFMTQKREATAAMASMPPSTAALV